MDFLTVLKIILFGIIEGITEWLPISSTGHMIILEEWLQLGNSLGQAYWELFLVVIQLGAILAVVVAFFKELWPWDKSKTLVKRREIYKIWLNIIIACIPATIFGLFLDDLLDKYLYNFITVSITLIIYGVAFILVETLFLKKDHTFKINDVSQFTWKTALIIGLAQVLSLIPGTSRSGITILAALLIGVDRSSGTRFTFYVSIPVMLGASLLKTGKYFIEGNSMNGSQIGYLVLGCTVAFLVSLVAIKFLTSFVNKHTFIGFGIYRIALGIVLICLFCTVLKSNDTINLIQACSNTRLLNSFY